MHPQASNVPSAFCPPLNVNDLEDFRLSREPGLNVFHNLFEPPHEGVLLTSGVLLSDTPVDPSSSLLSTSFSSARVKPLSFTAAQRTGHKAINEKDSINTILIAA